ncbi:ferric reductase like transmembrane component [Botrytis cinerea]
MFISEKSSAAATAKATAKAIRKRNNLNSVKYFAAAMAGITVLFVISKWIRFLYIRYTPRNKSRLLRTSIAITRYIVPTAEYDCPLSDINFVNRASRKILVRKIWGFTSIGQFILFLTYIATIFAVTFTNINNWSTYNNFAKRLGWISTAHIAFITFLALKNTPLAFLTWYSYESLRILHRLVGYGTILWSMLHAIFYIIAEAQSDSYDKLLEKNQIFGIIAGISMLLIFLTSLLVYKMQWGTRILMRRSSKLIKPGTHAFLWIPAIRQMETHPFTISSVDDAEGISFVVAACDGFTKALHTLAVESPGIQIRASIDGPYGSVVDFSQYDKVVFIAGGSGGSFTFGVALETMCEVAKKNAVSASTIVEFIWVVREEDSIGWFSSQLQELNSSPNVTVRLFCTRNVTNRVFNASSNGSSRNIFGEKDLESPTIASPSIEGSDEKSSWKLGDVEKVTTTSEANLINNAGDKSMMIQSGRPEILKIIQNVVEECDGSQRVAVVACGPGSLMDATRLAISKCIKVNGPSLEYHSEEFGW